MNKRKYKKMPFAIKKALAEGMTHEEIADSFVFPGPKFKKGEMEEIQMAIAKHRAEAKTHKEAMMTGEEIAEEERDDSQVDC